MAGILEQQIIGMKERQLRGRTFTIDPTDSDRKIPPMYYYQERVLKNMMKDFSHGLVHFPTGSGKTRVALEFIAAAIKRYPDIRIVWASYPKVLVRQPMTRLAEFSPALPAGLKFTWVHASKESRRDINLLKDHHVTFMLRDTLTDMLNDAADLRISEPIKELFFPQNGGKGNRFLLIYDECHQLGAEQWQLAYEKFHKKILVKKKMASKFRIVGLSATPLPTLEESRKTLRKIVFPYRRGDRMDKSWGVRVFDRVTNGELEDQNILCPINLAFQETGLFDIPSDLLEKIIETSAIDIPGENPTDAELLQFSKQFNRSVMGNENVIAFLAHRLASNLETIGKTLVFMPTIAAANTLADRLARFEGIAKDRVGLVHSKLDEFSFDGDMEHVRDAKEASEPYTQIKAFHDKKDEPCIMINVGMLTTGFDDPLIRTVVMGRLTFSENLYWQMIGRGTRGIRAGGTDYCNVIDPIQLTKLYHHLDKLRPTFEEVQVSKINTNIVVQKETEESSESRENYQRSTIRTLPIDVIENNPNMSKEEAEILIESILPEEFIGLEGYDKELICGLLIKFMKGEILTFEEQVELAERVSIEISDIDDELHITATDFDDSQKVYTSTLELTLCSFEHDVDDTLLDYLRKSLPTAAEQDDDIHLKIWWKLVQKVKEHKCSSVKDLLEAL